MNGSGAVYVFARRNGAWSQAAYVKAPNTGMDDVLIARDYHITTDDVRAALQYAGELARESVVALPTTAA